MNRNTNAHFSELPQVSIERSTFDKSHSNKLSGNVGDIIPIYVDPDIMPGDTVSIDTAKIIRFQTMLTPVMDQIYADVYWFFVPHRLIWDHWINFMGENTQSAWIPDSTYTVPQLVIPPVAGVGDTPNNNKVGTLLDYMDYPVELLKANPDYDPDTPGSKEFIPAQSNNVKISALPLRAYLKIFNDWFRDENLTDPVNLYTGDSDVTCTTEESYINDAPHGGAPLKAAKFADYFTACLPKPQKGEPVNINLNGTISGTLPVKTGADNVFETGSSVYPLLTHNTKNTSGTVSGTFLLDGSGDKKIYIGTSNGSPYQSVAVTGQQGIVPMNLWADSSDLSVSGLTFSVNDLRYAFQLQKLLERDARGGTRYIEQIKSHFGVDSPDARLQRPEYLGGNRFAVQVDQVTNTAQSESDFLGDLGAQSVTTDIHSDFTKSFTEHGTLLGLLVLRSDKTYCQGLQPWMKRKTRFDFYYPVFANIGEQPVPKDYLFLEAEGTFGYQEAWAEYRYGRNTVHSELRPYVSNGLASWTLADDYTSAPSLSDDWIREDKTNVDRVLAVTSSVSNQFWADIYFNASYTRPMPVYSVPGLIDHN